MEAGLRGKTCDKHLIVRCLRGEKKRSGCPLIETSLNLCVIESRAFHLHLIGSDWTILPKYKGWLDFERVCNCMELSPTCSNHHKTERQNTTETKQLFRAHKKKDNSCLHMLSLQNRRVYASQHLESQKKKSNVRN